MADRLDEIKRIAQKTELHGIETVHMPVGSYDWLISALEAERAETARLRQLCNMLAGKQDIGSGQEQYKEMPEDDFRNQHDACQDTADKLRSCEQ